MALEARGTSRLYVPALPTLWPGMLVARPRVQGFAPFDSPQVRWFYLARNALWLAARMMGLDRGEVLMPAYHHGVEVEALVEAGVTPRFYRVGPRWEVDVEDVERRIGPNTRALYLTHYAGFPGPAQAMRALADRHGLPLIEDCALSLLSAEGTSPLGRVGDVAVYCLYKTLPLPHGGALVLNGPRRYSPPELPPPPLASTLGGVVGSLLQNLELRGGPWQRRLVRTLRRLGRGTARAARVERVPTGTQHFDRRHVDLGMSPLALRLARVQGLEHIVEQRRRNYFLLLGRLRDVAPPLFNQLPAGVCPLFYPLVVEDKPAVLARLHAQGIEAIDFWRRSHPLCPEDEFPEVARLRRTVLELPCHQDLTPEVMGDMARVVREVLQEQRRRHQRAG